MPTETITAPSTQTANATPSTPSATATPAAPESQPAQAPAPPKTADPMEAVFADAKPKETTAKDAKPAEAPAKPADKKPETVPAKPAAKRGDEKDNSVITSIRNAEKSAKAEAAQLRAELDEFKRKGGGDTAALTTTIAEKDKRIAQLESELGGINYTKHPDFINKFQKPFQAATKTAQNVIESLSVVTGVDEDGNKTVRPASWNTDFIPLTNISGETPAKIRAAAREQIKKLFGEDAPEAMQQWDRLKELSDKRIEAVNEWNSRRGEMEAQERAKHLQASENYRKAFDIANQDLLEQHQDRFGERPDDEEYNKIRSAALAHVDTLFRSPEKLSAQEFIALSAAIRWRAGNFDALQQDHAKLKQENAELLARINGSEESAGGKTRKSGAEIASSDAAAEAEKMMQKAFGG